MPGCHSRQTVIHGKENLSRWSGHGSRGQPRTRGILRGPRRLRWSLSPPHYLIPRGVRTTNRTHRLRPGCAPGGGLGPPLTLRRPPRRGPGASPARARGPRPRRAVEAGQGWGGGRRRGQDPLSPPPPRPPPPAAGSPRAPVPVCGASGAGAAPPPCPAAAAAGPDGSGSVRPGRHVSGAVHCGAKAGGSAPRAAALRGGGGGYRAGHGARTTPALPGSPPVPQSLLLAEGATRPPPPSGLPGVQGLPPSHSGKRG